MLTTSVLPSSSILPTSFEMSFQSIDALQTALLGAVTAIVSDVFNYLGTTIVP